MYTLVHKLAGDLLSLSLGPILRTARDDLLKTESQLRKIPIGGQSTWIFMMSLI